MDPLFQIFGQVWRPAIEIAILALSLYAVAKYARGTRGAAVFSGFLVLLIALAILTHVLQLKVLTWLLGVVYQVLAVAVVVIFQPELRQLLARLGNWQLFAPAHEQRENIEVIIQTVERLAEVRIGALIAIEKAMSLQDAVESGLPVDCVATPEMLECIFFPNNAIHDGGVILKNGRITFAACIFPLTQREDLSKSLGTRHRAAIGLSEETDAVVVAVSEETGSISYAHQGQFVRGLSLEQLRAFLTEVFQASSKSPRSVLDWLRRRTVEPSPTGPADGSKPLSP